LLSIVISLILLCSVGLVAIPFQLALAASPSDRYAIGVVSPILTATFLVAMLVAYALGRTGRNGTAASIVVALVLATSYVGALSTGEQFFLVTLSLSVFMAGIVASWQVTLVFFILASALMASLPFLVSGFSFVGVVTYLLITLMVGTLSVVSAAIRDRDLVQIEEQSHELLAHQEKLLGARKMETIARLSAGVAHEFNNILTGVMGYAEVIKIKPAESAPEYAQLIQDMGKRASELTEHLLSFSRQQLLRATAISINSLVKTQAAIVDIPVVLDLAPEPSFTVLDPVLVGQAIETLLRRSARRTGPGGAVTVRTFSETVRENQGSLLEGEYRVITVSDDGPPLDEKIVQRVFDPFYTTGEFGTGEMDLAAAYGIITQSGGNLSSRQNPAGGNSYVVYLPASRMDDSSV
jgi:signal transduction histidine kinase